MSRNLEMRHRRSPWTFTVRLVLMATLATAGCVPSLHPLYTDGDLIFDPALVGVWAEKENDNETWSFQKRGEKAYRLVVTDDGKTGEFEAHLLRLGNTLFLDLYPEEAGLEGINRNDFYKGHLLSAHTFLKVIQVEPTLQMAFIETRWLEQYVEKNPAAIRHEVVSERILLTASTKALQEFVVTHAEEAFGEFSSLKRIRSRQTGAKTEVRSADPMAPIR